MNKLIGSFKDKTVIVTGHSGFKGSWLSAWLVQLGAKVVGISLNSVSTPYHFSVANLSRDITDLKVDIRDQNELQKIFLTYKPDFVFHLAAKAIVNECFQNPSQAWATNLGGTVNVLESLRNLDNKCAAVIITSDKCYENKEWVWGYRETDILGGVDPYSASKASAELAVKSFTESYFPTQTSLVRIATARAGNVIGGGDWAAHRVIPDCAKAWSTKSVVSLRNPNSTRPWQHVLEPLSGYLALASSLVSDSKIHGQAFNFGPQPQQNNSVLELVTELKKHWPDFSWNEVSGSSKSLHESILLKLNCEKSSYFLKWHAILKFSETVRLTAEWYKHFYKQPGDIRKTTDKQIKDYCFKAKEDGLEWAQ